MPPRLELFLGTDSMDRAFELFRHDLGSPVCTEYSRVLTRRPRRLEESDRLVLRTLHLIQELQPRFWAIENPATGLQDVSYCTYGYFYRKLTRIWSNLDWVSEQPKAQPAQASPGGEVTTKRQLAETMHRFSRKNLG